MKVNEKRCRGTGKAIGYGCGEMQLVRKYGLGLKCGCFNNWLVNTPAGQETIKKAVNFARRKEIKEYKKAEKEKKQSIIDYSKKLQDKVNEIVRLIDIGLPCLAKRIHANQIQAGHIYSRGSNRSMRYNLHNIHRQSAQSNHFQNEDGLLREGLKNEYGEDYFTFIHELQQTPALHYSNADYKQFYQTACKIVVRMKRDGRVFDLQERVEMRNKINIELGIYEDKFCNFIK